MVQHDKVPHPGVRDFFSSVQQPDPGVEVGREGEPDEVRGLEPGRGTVYAVKGGGHGRGEAKEQQQDQKRRKVRPGEEEHQRPGEIHRQLHPPEPLRPLDARAAFVFHRREPDAHEDIERRPHDGEHRCRRTERRLFQQGEDLLHALPRDEA